jgi:hypothetical protein
MIGTEMPRCALAVPGGIEHSADVGACDGAVLYAEADQTTRALVHDHEHPVASEYDGLAAKEVHAHGLSAVWPMNANQEGPFPPGAGR